MNNALIYCIYPRKAQTINFKNRYGVLNLLGRLFSIWNKKKTPLKIRKTFLLKDIETLSKHTLWLYLKELQTKKVITISKKDYDNDTMIIDFTEDFIKNYVNDEIEAEYNDIQEEVAEEFDGENFNAKENKKPTNADYNHDDDYLPVDGWYNTDRQDFRCLLRKYGGKVPEIPEEVLNFEFGKIKREDYPEESYITADGHIYIYDDYYEKFSLSYKIKEFIKLRENKELMLIDWLSFYDDLMGIWEHLKAKGLV